MTRWDAIDPICLMDHRGLDHGICLLPTMPLPSWDYATAPLYLHLPDGSSRSGSWHMSTTNYAIALLRLRPLLRLRTLLLSTSICLMDRGGLHRGICLLWAIHTLCHIHWMCFNSNLSFCTHDIYCTCPSWRGILLCCSPEGFFTFFPWRVIWEFFLIRCEVLEQGCLCVQIVKHWLGEATQREVF